MESDKKRQKPTLSPITGLTPQQEQAATLLAGGESVTEVAQHIGVHRSTLYDWQSNTAFKCYYNQQCRDSQEAVKNALLRLHSVAVDAVAHILANGGENARLKAATWILERVQSIEIGETRLREALKRQCSHNTLLGDWGADRVNKTEYREALKSYGLREE